MKNTQNLTDRSVDPHNPNWEAGVQLWFPFMGRDQPELHIRSSVCIPEDPDPPEAP